MAHLLQSSAGFDVVSQHDLSGCADARQVVRAGEFLGVTANNLRVEPSVPVRMTDRVGGGGLTPTRPPPWPLGRLEEAGTA